MPKKKPGMTPEEQSQRFREEAERLIAAGELSPTDADEGLERVLQPSRADKPS
jgi:hypothetical protein